LNTGFGRRDGGQTIDALCEAHAGELASLREMHAQRLVQHERDQADAAPRGSGVRASPRRIDHALGAGRRHPAGEDADTFDRRSLDLAAELDEDFIVIGAAAGSICRIW
jgi:hypothetical protein